ESQIMRPSQHRPHSLESSQSLPHLGNAGGGPARHGECPALENRSPCQVVGKFLLCTEFYRRCSPLVSGVPGTEQLLERGSIRQGHSLAKGVRELLGADQRLTTAGKSLIRIAKPPQSMRRHGETEHRQIHAKKRGMGAVLLGIA